MTEFSNSDYNPQEIAAEILGDDFSEVHGRRIGASHSGHGVIFGSFRGVEVALKPFVGRHPSQRAEHESRMMNTVQNAGLRTLDPLQPTAVFADPSEKWAALLTHYQDNLIGGNALSLEAEPFSQHGEQVGRFMGLIALTLARLHSEQITHGDPQAKNFGFSPVLGLDQEPVIFDLEGSTPHGKKGMGRGQFQSSTRRDLTRLTYSLSAQGYGGENDFLALRHMQTSVLDPYTEALEGPARSALDIGKLYTHTSSNFAMQRLKEMERRQNRPQQQIPQAG